MQFYVLFVKNSVNPDRNKLTVSSRMVKIVTIGRKSLHPDKTLTLSWKWITYLIVRSPYNFRESNERFRVFFFKLRWFLCYIFLVRFDVFLLCWFVYVYVFFSNDASSFGSSWHSPHLHPHLNPALSHLFPLIDRREWNLPYWTHSSLE